MEPEVPLCIPHREVLNEKNISFQLILDSKSILLSSAPDGRIRANINQLDEHQLRNIVEGIAAHRPGSAGSISVIGQRKIPGSKTAGGIKMPDRVQKWYEEFKVISAHKFWQDKRV